MVRNLCLWYILTIFSYSLIYRYFLLIAATWWSDLFLLLWSYSHIFINLTTSASFIWKWERFHNWCPPHVFLLETLRYYCMKFLLLHVYMILMYLVKLWFAFELVHNFFPANVISNMSDVNNGGVQLASMSRCATGFV